MTASFKVGDKVRLLNEKGEGVVTKVVNSTLLEVAIDGFDFRYHPSDLVIITTDDELQNPKYHKNYEDKDRKTIKKNSDKVQVKRKIDATTVEIDIHIHELTDRYKHLTNGEIINIQLDTLVRELDRAIQNNMDKVIVIHGVGTGVLKREVRTILKQYANIEFYDASYQRYGYGATEVIIR